MRIGLVCPYSLTVPGGVQGQVLGLARELRRLGHEARVLGPCDGPPPESFVTPLGNSLPTAANGSMAPIAPDASAALRTIRALNDEAFDIVHVHEPLAPGPTMTSVLMHPAPMVGTFHAAGRSTSYQVFASGPLRWAAGRIDRKVVVSKDAMELVQSHLGGEYDILFNGVEIDLIASTAADADGVPDDLLLRAPRGAQGPRRAARGVRARCPPTPACGSPATAPTAPACGPSTPTTSGSAGSGGSATPRSSPACAGPSVFCAPSLHGESFGVVLIEAMAAGTPVVASGIDGYRNVATDGVDALLVEPGDADALADGDRRRARRPPARPSRCAPPATGGPRRSR